MSASIPEITGELRIYGNLSLLAMAPVLPAADRIYPGKTVIEHGAPKVVARVRRHVTL